MKNTYKIIIYECWQNTQHSTLRNGLSGQRLQKVGTFFVLFLAITRPNVDTYFL